MNDTSATETGSIAPPENEDPSAGYLKPVGHIRWTICALLFFATTINYMDRQVLGLLAPDLQKIFHWNEIQYSNIGTAFLAAYAIGLLFAGRIIDRIGTRLGYAIAISIWSLAAMGHSLSQSILGFGFARFMLGLGESANFPAAIKTVAEWFPKRERAFATGIFNSGANIGAIVAPLLVPIVVRNLGWRWAFVFTGIFSITWLICWLRFYRPPETHPSVTPAELEYIRSDPPEPATKIAWAQLFPHRQTWAFVIGKALTDPIWWLYLFWLPKYLNSQHGRTLDLLALPLVIVYVMSDVGSIAGGWFSSFLIKRGWSIHKARKTTMLICALGVTPVVFAANTKSLWLAVAIISLAAASHQGWSANLFTLASDMFPRGAVGSVVGIGGFGGAVGGMFMAKLTGFTLDKTGSYLPIFAIAAACYLTALLIIHLLVPKMEMAVIDTMEPK